jgi:hypothetical protein
MAVVVTGELAKNALDLASIEDKWAIEALAANGPDELLGEGVCTGRRDGSANDPHAVGAKHFIEAGGELGVSIRPGTSPVGRAGPCVRLSASDRDFNLRA